MMPTTRAQLQRAFIAAAQADPRIVGLLDYGSSSEGRADAWSDLDLAFFIRDADRDAFEAAWEAWAAQFGTLLLAYISGVGNPWAVYAGTPLPLRVDFNFHPESAIAALPTWPNAPQSVAEMVLYDGTGGRLAAEAGRLVGQALGPADPAATYRQICGDFWYYILRTMGRIERGQQWGARQDFHSIVLNLLIALLRLEVGATARWRASTPPVGIEQVLAPARLAALEACIPAPGMAGVRDALAHAARLGQVTCAASQAAHGWPWPESLAATIAALLPLPPGAPPAPG